MTMQTLREMATWGQVVLIPLLVVIILLVPYSRRDRHAAGNAATSSYSKA